MEVGMMNAYVHERYGSPDVLELRSVPRPEPDEGQVLVRVRAASVNPADWYGLAGRPTWRALPLGFGARDGRESAATSQAWSRRPAKRSTALGTARSASTPPSPRIVSPGSRPT